MIWSYGITTVPERASSTLPGTIESLKGAGFNDPILFIDNCSDPSIYHNLGLRYVCHSTRVRTVGNWITALWNLYTISPHAEMYAIFQDDILLCRNTRSYIETLQIPSKSYLNLFTFRDNHRLVRFCGNGLHKSDQLGKGAIALVFSREAVASLLASSHPAKWVSDAGKGFRLVDRMISQSFRREGYTEYVHNPSLTQHTGHVSSMGSDPHPDSACFPGESFDAMSLISSRTEQLKPASEKPVIRVAIPAVDSFDLTAQCLSHLSTNKWPMIVDYIDNGSASGTSRRVELLCADLGINVNCITFPKNVGFTKAVNASIDIAIQKNQHCLILNNDCMVASDTVQKLHSAMMADESICAVGPVTMDRGNQSLRNKYIQSATGLASLPRRPEDVEAISAALKNQKSSPVKSLAFFCTLIRNTAIQSIGRLPEVFTDGLGADDAWCHLARKSGGKCNVVYNAYAHHMHSQTFKRLGIDRQRASKAAVKKLRKFN